MALKIRLQRGGTTHNPVYRIVVAENSARRDGRFVEILGNYAPQARGKEMEYQLKMDRADYWMSVGAKPTDTVRNIIRAIKRGETGESKQPSNKSPRPKTEAKPAPKAEEAPKEEAPAAEEAPAEAAAESEETAEQSAS